MLAFDKDKLFLLHFRAQAVEGEIASDTLRAAINFAIEKANKSVPQAETAGREAVNPVGPNQKPRMLQISGWIAHSTNLEAGRGAPNRNSSAFTEEDLQEAVAKGLFQAPYVGMIDYNHDFTSYGVWYKAEYAWDEAAGAFGILAHGAIFAWRYTDLADKMLAMQSRQGFIDLSMACMPEFYEPGETASGETFSWVRKPVFFTTSVLDVDPADEKARGLGSENPEHTEDQRVAELLKASMDATNEEEYMKELMDKFEAMLGEQAAQFAPLFEAAKALPEVEAALATIKDEMATERAAAVVAATEPLAATIASLTTEKATAEIALAALKTAFDEMEAKFVELTDWQTKVHQEEADKLEAAVRASRLALIPDTIKVEMEKDENKSLMEQWMTQSEEDFAITTRLFTVASPTKSPADLSAEEGRLSSASDKAEGEWAITKHRKAVR